MQEKININWNFDNSFLNLPREMLSKQKPNLVNSPEIIIINYKLSEQLGLNLKSIDANNLAISFSGNKIPKNTETYAFAYAGHQFGHFTILGDGRAILLGEHINKNKRYDIQFKGSGKTEYSRNGDGKAALGPMLREYIISEAMYSLNIPTTRSLAVVKTGEKIIRETELNGAILTRVASSHIRVGTFQFFTYKKDKKNLEMLVDYTIKRHFPEIKIDENKYINLIDRLMNKQINLVVDWMRVGFIHGVMNTDNMSLSGETIDYGPCAFMDTYDPKTVFSSIDHLGRYAYYNQPTITKWNLARFAECLIPFLSKDKNEAIEIATSKINEFDKIYEGKWLNMMRGKLGILDEDKQDEVLIFDLLQWMHLNKADYTNTFCNLIDENIIPDPVFKRKDFVDWKDRLKQRLLRFKNKFRDVNLIMKTSNPLIIPRNQKVEEALEAAENNDLSKVKRLLEILSKPYDNQDNVKEFQKPFNGSKIEYKTYCGT